MTISHKISTSIGDLNSLEVLTRPASAPATDHKMWRELDWSARRIRTRTTRSATIVDGTLLVVIRCDDASLTETFTEWVHRFKSWFSWQPGTELKDVELQVFKTGRGGSGAEGPTAVFRKRVADRSVKAFKLTFEIEEAETLDEDGLAILSNLIRHAMPDAQIVDTEIDGTVEVTVSSVLTIHQVRMAMAPVEGYKSAEFVSFLEG